MAQDSQQVLGDEIGRILSEAGVTPEQAKYLRTGFIEMIQKNTITLEADVEFTEPVVNQVQMKNASIKGVTQIAQMMLAKNIFKIEKVEDNKVKVAIHLIRNAGL